MDYIFLVACGSEFFREVVHNFGPRLKRTESYKFGVVIVRLLVSEWVSQWLSQIKDLKENASNQFDNFFHEDREP